LDQAGVALVIVDDDGDFAFTNQSALRMFGITRPMNGMSLVDWRRDYRFQNTEGLEIPIEQSLIMRALAGEQTDPQDIRVTLPDANIRWLHGASHRFSVLGLNGVFMIITDETDQIELRRIAEREHRLETAGLVAGGLAHDFDNMLSIVTGNINLALCDPEVSVDTRGNLQLAARAAHKAAAVASRFGQVSHPHETRIRGIAVNDIVNASLGLVHPLPGSGVALTLDLREGLPKIEADPEEIEQALINLILHALDAMPQGGELKVSTGFEYRPTGEGGRSKQFVTIGVSDTGMGIPKHLQARIFEPFFTFKPEGRGSGLGLSSAYRIVRQHGGRIEVESAPGTGTKFTVFLPAKRAF
jgi:signal transduction histidine kinase